MTETAAEFEHCTHCPGPSDPRHQDPEFAKAEAQCAYYEHPENRGTERLTVEVWDRASCNMLLSAPEDEAWEWVRSYRAGQGDEATTLLSVGAADDSWVLTGPDLLERLTP